MRLRPIEEGIGVLKRVRPSHYAKSQRRCHLVKPVTKQTEKSMVMRRIVVRSSPVHGRGVFAVARIQAGERIVEYKGKIVSWQQAQRQYARSAAEDGHTFYFDLDDGRVIDGGQGGNSARWVNHGCAPNCEAEQDGSRVFFHALRDIAPGEELFIDYQLFVEGRTTAALKKLYACRCGADACRGTMLALS
jgi:hypothetical protein